MMPLAFAELLRLQRAAVIALKPLCLDVEVRAESTPRGLLLAALRTRRSLKSTRFLSTQVGSTDAARRMFALTQPAFDALNQLVAECEIEIGDREEASAC